MARPETAYRDIAEHCKSAMQLRGKRDARTAQSRDFNQLSSI